MQRSEAFLEAYNGVELDLPPRGRVVEVEGRGRVLHCRALKVTESAHWLGVLDRVVNPRDTASQNRALVELLTGFAEAVGIEDEELAPGEVVEVARSFFGRLTWSPQVEATTKNGAPEGSSSTRGSTT